LPPFGRTGWHAALGERLKKEQFLIIASYALVYIVWGSTYFFIRAAVQTIHPSVVVGVRFISGAFLLALLAWFRGGLRRVPPIKELLGAAVLGILLLLLGNGLVTIAEKSIPSWTASLVIACMPIYVAFFNFMLYRTKVSAIRLLGAFGGIAGVVLIFAPGNSLEAVFDRYILVALAGALFWGLGTSLAKKMTKPQDVLVSTSIQMLVAGIASLAIGMASGINPISSFSGASAWSIFSLAYLALLGALALVAYNHLLVHEPSFRVSSYSLVNPLIAVTLGLLTGEKATPLLAVGSPLVLAGLVFILYGDAILKAKKKNPQA